MWLAANTGMRRGELAGLRWIDIDIDHHRLSIRRSVSCTGYSVHVTPTKTRTSRRCIDLDARTIAVLMAWRDDQAAEGCRNTDAVFTRAEEHRCIPTLSQTFDRLQRGAGVSRIRFHDLRHTHATLLLKAGEPIKVVSERLGHSTPAFTMAVYQHVLPGMGRHAAVTFARLLEEPAAPGDPDVVPVAGR